MRVHSFTGTVIDHNLSYEATEDKDGRLNHESVGLLELAFNKF